MVACDLSTCSRTYTGRKCKCYPVTDEMDLRGLPSEERTKRINAGQFCAFESDDGVLYGCDKGCCQGGCPGQCDGVDPRPPTGTYIKPTGQEAKYNIPTRVVIQFILIIATILILIAILSLYA